MYGYIYETTNLVNGKKYIGKHKSSRYDKRYKGSGALITKAIKKYGRDNFQCIILERCDSLSMLDEREIYWINYKNAVQDPSYYNILAGGEGGKGFKGHKHTEETKQILREKRKFQVISDETRAKISAANKRRGSSSLETRQKISISLKKHYMSTRKERPIYTEEEKIQRRLDANRRRSETMKGHKVSEETRKKLSIKNKGKTAWNKGLTKRDYPSNK